MHRSASEAKRRRLREGYAPEGAHMKSWLVPPVVLPILLAMWIVISAFYRVYG